ncbi:RHS repeat-associated core domain-containing protein, partial [Parapedobacter sp. DT-150]|uniref:RHS repeat-associated core domain-containing protein n=1 Tax=Parapedobacter sp. DT-150 TaxID=3396162 RepID=UPI003F1C15BF
RLAAGMMAGGKNRESLVYDAMGNITALRRTDAAGTRVDSLAYTHSGNRLSSVADATATVHPAGLPYQMPGTTAYTYDGNGNLLTRKNTNTGSSQSRNNITAAAYNHLNLPQSVTVPAGTVAYTYDATGRKLRRVAGGMATDYIDGIEWEDNALTLIHMEEGRILPGGTVTYEYVLRDHLGNTRNGFASTATGTPRFRTDYYAYGLSHEGRLVASPENNYLYNGKELQEELGLYDYGARFYDPVIGRWGTVDPLAGKYPSISGYNYALNNPISVIDPDGQEPITLTALAIRAAVGAVIGAGIDLTVQMTANMTVNNQSFGDALSNVDWSSIGSSAAVGAIGVPGSNLVTSSVKTTALATAITFDATIDISAERGFETVFDGSKSVTNAVIDASSSALGGKTAEGIVNSTVKAVNGDIKAGSFATLNNAQKAGLRQIQNVVGGQGFEAATNTVIGLATEATKTGVSSLVTVPGKTGTSSSGTLNLKTIQMPKLTHPTDGIRNEIIRPRK